MNKREFLKVAGLGGLAMSGSAGLVSCSKEPAGASTNFPETLELAKKQHKQSFNMTGYAAPAWGWETAVSELSREWSTLPILKSGLLPI